MRVGTSTPFTVSITKKERTGSIVSSMIVWIEVIMEPMNRAKGAGIR